MSRILFIDDERDMLEMMRDYLEDVEGYGVLLADDAKKGLRLADEAAPDLVLLDLLMPGMDGLETLRRIREKHPRMRVVILTAQGFQFEEEAKALGASHYVTKPCDLDYLKKVISEALSLWA